MNLPISAIDSLLCACLGDIDNQLLAAQLSALTAADWDALVTRAIQLDVPSLLYQRLKNETLQVFAPQVCIDLLRSKYLRVAHANTLIYFELGKVLRAFSKAGIQTIPLKGAYLAEHIYANIALRAMSDADLFIHESKLEQASKILLDIGYANKPFWVSAEMDEAHSLPPFSKINAPDLDIHWTFENPDSPFRIDEAGIWQRARASRLAEVDVLALTPEDLLLHLCLHTAYHHRFEGGFKGLCDIAQILSRSDLNIDWQLFLQRTHTWGATRVVYIALLLTKELLNIEPSTNILDALQPADFDPQLLSLALDHIFPASRGQASVSVNLSRSLAQQSLAGKIRMFSAFIFPARSLMSVRYGISPTSWKVYLYYPRRWFDLLRNHGPAFWKVMTGDPASRAANQLGVDGWKLSDWMTTGDSANPKIPFK